jgi:dTDP-4-amino-4,6-dideoxygalactose transaminase
MKIGNGKRDELQAFLAEKGVPANIYYPLPLYHQDAFKEYVPEGFELPVTEKLCEQVLSLPIHTEMDESLSECIAETVKAFFYGEK